jgi:hypothetical protein
MNKTKFRLKLVAVALLVASPIVAVVIIAQRPHAVGIGDTTELRVSHK